MRSWFAHPPVWSGLRGIILFELTSVSPGEDTVYRQELGSAESPTGAGREVRRVAETAAADTSVGTGCGRYLATFLGLGLLVQHSWF